MYGSNFADHNSSIILPIGILLLILIIIGLVILVFYYKNKKPSKSDSTNSSKIIGFKVNTQDKNLKIIFDDTQKILSNIQNKLGLNIWKMFLNTYSTWKKNMDDLISLTNMSWENYSKTQQLHRPHMNSDEAGIAWGFINEDYFTFFKKNIITCPGFFLNAFSNLLTIHFNDKVSGGSNPLVTLLKVLLHHLSI